jgi:hypothetical protein
MAVAVRQRHYLVRDFLVAAAGAALMVFYISAFTSAMQSTEVVQQAEIQIDDEGPPRIALQTR